MGVEMKFPKLGVLCLAALPMFAALADDITDEAVFASSAFQASHPDVRNRRLGFEAYDKGDYTQAYENFSNAASYADKPSLAKMAMMTWDGRGVPADHARAYALMKVAAERQYPKFLEQARIYWSQLDGDERARVPAQINQLMNLYGDAGAKPRMAAKLAEGRSQVTGSRLGSSTSPVKVIVPTAQGVATTIDGSQFYSSQYWNPDQYWKWVDSGWMDTREGHVDLGDFKAIEGDAGQARPAQP